MVAVGVFGYGLWLSLRPAGIISVHHRGHGSSAVLVKNFPFTDKGKISWWLKNKDMLKEKHDVTQQEKDFDFTVVFWLFDDSYDRLCFDDMPLPLNCIDKNRFFSANHSQNRGISFITSGGIYRMKENGQTVKDNAE